MQSLTSAKREKAFLVGWESTRGDTRARGGMDTDELLPELSELVESAGGAVVGSLVQHSPAPDAATLIGSGKVEDVRAEAGAAGAELIVFDHDLSPTQLRNLERALDVKVLDRTQLILDIFANRARSREGKLQVELAQLSYLLPRLGGMGIALSRLGGGIGTRGPGEQKLEMDRRRIRARIKKLRESIDRVRAQRGLHREHRRELEFHTVSLVGYTNAGKSTLFNALTHAGVAASSRMFATLDPTVRAITLPSRRRALISDTVGFIRHLPHHLVAAFRATLEELEDASVLLHVSDASSPEREAQDSAVESLLEELGVSAVPRIHAWNKIDKLEPAERDRLPAGPADFSVSATKRLGLDRLLQGVDEALTRDPLVVADFDLPGSDGRRLALLHRGGQVLSTRFERGRIHVRARVPTSLRGRVLAGLTPPAKLVEQVK
jgi:GTP-binding protein HflX